MSSRRTGWPRARSTGLLLAWLLVGAVACFMPPTDGKMVGPPSFAGLLQEFATFVDEGNDGSSDDLEAGSITAGAGDPGVLSTSTSTQSVSLSAESDADSVLVHCEHTLSPGTSETGCEGTVRAVFDLAEPGETSFLVAAVKSPSGLATPFGLSASLVGTASVVCGSVSGTATVHNPANPILGQEESLTIVLEVDSPCTVTIEPAASVTTSGLAVPTAFIQTVSVTAVTAPVPDCTRGSQCPAEAPFCDANGSCGTGDDGQPGVVASVHCGTPYVSQNACSHGVSGSVCRGDFECADGYSCNGLGVCVGDTACSSDVDCPPSASICTEQGTCSPQGEQGEGCVTSDFCRQGLFCLSNRCTVRLGEGGDCTQPFTACDGGTVCFPSMGTCETPLPLGSTCSADVECAEFPVSNACNEAIGGGVCSVRQPAGGPCAEDLDCEAVAVCDTGTNFCE